MNAPPLLARLDARDRALFARMALADTTKRSTRLAWCALTQLGGARFSIGASLLLALFRDGSLARAWRTLLVLGASHLLVQIVKRSAGRKRPTTGQSFHALTVIPDRFSFPSGHACAAMVLAASYASLYPAAAIPLLALAVVVGLSRVMLGVHYPGDVVVGQGIALVSSAIMGMPPDY